MTSTALDQTVEGRLQEREVRYTRARRAVVAALAAAEGPRSANELHAEIGNDVPLSSLYRTLAVLGETGVLVPHHGARGITRYELAEWIAGHHHHLVCTECGGVEDIDIPSHHEAAIRAVVGDIAALASFTPTDHVLEIEGRCTRCT
jgi:Fe2+ or Zn2+ uptake regulation protein